MQADADLAQAVHVGDGHSGVLHDHAFGHLDVETLWLQVGVSKRLKHLLDQIRLPELPR